MLPKKWYVRKWWTMYEDEIINLFLVLDCNNEFIECFTDKDEAERIVNFHNREEEI